MNFQQIRDFVNPQVAQATGMQPVDDLQMPVPVAHIVQDLVIDGQLSDTSTNPVQNKVIKAAIDDITEQFEGGIEEAVDNWLDDNPQATTTVQDGAITYAKLDNNLKAKADEVTELKNALTYSTSVEYIPLTLNAYIKESNGVLDVAHPVSPSSFAYGIIACNANDVFVVNAESYNGAYPLGWYFTDENYATIIKAAQNTVYENQQLYAPVNAKWLIIHVKSPYKPSYKGLNVLTVMRTNAQKEFLSKSNNAYLEIGGLNETTGVNTAIASNTRIRSDYIDLEKIISVRIKDENLRFLRFYVYAYASDYTYLGVIYNKQTIKPSEVTATYSTAKYIRFVLYYYNSTSTPIDGYLPQLLDSIVIRQYKYPRLSNAQRTAIKNLADSYYDIRSRFVYSTTSVRSNYASIAEAVTGGKYRICCSLLAELLWMGRSSSDFPENTDNYTRNITKAFNFGYYFAFNNLNCRRLKGDDYYGFTNPYNDPNYVNSYSWNTYYSQGSTNDKKQAWNEYGYANDMCKEADRIGFSISMDELDVGDLIFTKSPELNNATNNFESIAYKNINHVAIVYDKTDDGISIIESTSKFDDAIHISTPLTNEGKVRIAYLLGNAVGFARLPYHEGICGYVPSQI